MSDMTSPGSQGMLAQLLDGSVKSLSLWSCYFFSKGVAGAFWPSTYRIEPHAGTSPRESYGNRTLKTKTGWVGGAPGVVGTGKRETSRGASGWGTQGARTSQRERQPSITNYVPGTQATAGIHLFRVAVLKARAHFQKGRGHRDS